MHCTDTPTSSRFHSRSAVTTDLVTFSTAELGSFTGAAKALGLTQAAASQRIQVLERALNESLFDRRGGRVALTEAGRKLYATAQQIHDLHREARKEITGHESPLTGELEIAASSVPGEHLLHTPVRVRSEVPAPPGPCRRQ